MIKRLQLLGTGLVVMGLVFFAVGGYTLYKTQQGANALQAYSAAQNVTLTYNADGQLADAKGDTTEATAIMGLLTNDWGYAVDKAELNPNDPVVNTASEYMYQMATITYHTLHAATTVTIPEDVVATVRSSQRPARTTSRTTASTGPASIGPTRSRARPAGRSGPRPLSPSSAPRRRQRDRLRAPDGPRHRGSLRADRITVVVTGLGLVWATRASTEKAKAPAFKQVANPA